MVSWKKFNQVLEIYLRVALQSTEAVYTNLRGPSYFKDI